MTIRRVNDTIAVADQIKVEDIEHIAQEGFRSVVCNRPDGEAVDQTQYAAIEAAAKAAGLEIRWQPVVGATMTDDDGAQFGRIVDALPKPVLAYCRTGTRCISLWSLSQAGKQPVKDILAVAQRAGYDLSGLAARIANIANSKGGGGD